MNLLKLCLKKCFHISFLIILGTGLIHGLEVPPNDETSAVVESDLKGTVSVFNGGTGTEADPYQIANADQLNAVRNNLGAHYILIADIDLDVAPYNTGGGWDPIGGGRTSRLPFSGSINGQMHSISNLYINAKVDYVKFVGLFGYARDSKIEKLRVENVNIIGDYRTEAGGLVSNMVNSQIIQVMTSGTITTMDWAGGLLGKSDGVYIVESFSTIEIKDSNAGGFIGWAAGTSSVVKDSYFRGSIINKPGSGIAQRIDVVPIIEWCYAEKKPGSTINNLVDNNGTGIMQNSNSWLFNLSNNSSRYVDISNFPLDFFRESFFIQHLSMSDPIKRPDEDFDNVWAVNPDINDGFPVLRAFYSGTTAPEATNVGISGNTTLAVELTADYTYTDPDGHTEVEFDPDNSLGSLSDDDREQNPYRTTFQWYRSDDALGTNKVAIDGANRKKYTTSDDDDNKYLSVKITPGDGFDRGIEVESGIVGPFVVPPSLVSASKTNNTTITLTYSENVQTNGTNPTDFTVTDCRGNTFEVTAQTDGTAGDTEIVLTVASMEFAVGDINISYTNNNAEISDLLGREQVTDNLGVNIKAPADAVVPTLVSASKDNSTQITLSFSENVTAFGSHPTDFTVTDGIGNTYAVSAISDGTVGDDKVALTIADISEALGDLTITYTNNNNEISDFQCNNLATDATGVTIEDNIAPTLISATKDSEEQITLTFSEPVLINGADANNFTVVDGNSNGFCILSLVDGTANDNQLILGMSDLSSGLIKLSITYNPSSGNISDFGGNTLAADATGVEISLNEPPTATEISFSGSLIAGETLTGAYTYTDAENDEESGTTFKWYRSDDVNGTGKVAIAGITTQTYDLSSNDVGKYISFEVTPNDGKNVGTAVESSLQGSVTKISQLITFNALTEKTYGEADFSLSATATSNLGLTYTSSNTNVATISGSTVTIIGAGNTTITASQSGNDTYAAATAVNQVLKIGKATLTATADDKSKTYGKANPAFTISYTGFVNGDDKTAITTAPTAATLADATSGVGVYDITLSGGIANNYSFVTNDGSLTVGKATLTATADNKSKVYGEANPALTVSYTGFV
ncbi:MBG domain-containing protein, partial [Roseivirga echinicomitans]